MGQQFQGFVAVAPTNIPNITAQLDGNHALLWLGAIGVPGEIYLRTGIGEDTMALLGEHGRMWLGANRVAGEIYVRTGIGEDTMALLGEHGRMWLGANRVAGEIYVRTGDGGDTMALLGEHGRMWLGASGVAGEIYVRTGDGGDTMALLGRYGRMWLGASGVPGNLYMRTGDGTDTIHLDGASGEIVFVNADCAEDFAVEDAAAAEPGTVMVLGDDELLHASEREYDTAVVGVVSGAGDLKPGIVLARGAAEGTRVPIALLGKAFCKADAVQSPIKVGDMLTTSSTVGHAMRSEPSAKAFGTIIGKALAPLREGRGLVPVLIALQ